MRFKILTLAAAMTVLAACANKPTGDNNQASTGSSVSPTESTAEGGLTLQQKLKDQVGDRIFFDYDKSAIKPEAKEVLQRQSKFASENAQLTFTVEGHCDERGTREYNLALGERRATADKKALVALGVQANRLQTISYGKERPEDPGHDEAAWAKNRRAVLVIN